jgi:hypothetical protein
MRCQELYRAISLLKMPTSRYNLRMHNKVFLRTLQLFLCITSTGYCDFLEIKEEITHLERSDYVTIVFTVPETHANQVREAMGRAGAGKIGNYSYCSYSLKGIGRFMPNEDATPYLGKEGVLEEVVEERVETVCSRVLLEHVLEEIKKAHPYEEMVIDIYPVYEIGRKKAKSNYE